MVLLRFLAQRIPNRPGFMSHRNRSDRAAPHRYGVSTSITDNRESPSAKRLVGVAGIPTGARRKLLAIHKATTPVDRTELSRTSFNSREVLRVPRYEKTTATSIFLDDSSPSFPARGGPTPYGSVSACLRILSAPLAETLAFFSEAAPFSLMTSERHGDRMAFSSFWTSKYTRKQQKTIINLNCRPISETMWSGKRRSRGSKKEASNGDSRGAYVR